MDTRKDFYHLSIDVVDRPGLFQCLEEDLEAGKSVNVNFLNAHCFNESLRDERYLSALKHTDYLLNDGIGIDIGARRLGFEFPENMNGTDLIPELVGWMADKSIPVFFLGARPEVIPKAVDALKARFANLDVAGFSSGFYDSEDELNRMIRACGAKAVVVGMGVPRQELWVERNRHELPDVKLFVAGGAIFDFLSGTVRRAPEWVQAVKMEWAFRLFQEPVRLFQRYMIGNFVFLWRIFTYRSTGNGQSAIKKTGG